MEPVQPASTNPLSTQRIGLALSGGGFRASIFHLGVIRRLEELNIMKEVDVISTVSGGSIIGAYYVCEMEQRLRSLTDQERADPSHRVRLHKQIAAAFLSAVEMNLRTRALIFTPFYHPWMFLKTLFLRAFRSTARSELIQSEYDKWFYDRTTLDQLPAVTPADVPKTSTMPYGPKLVINTTSLLTGDRVSFSREPVSGFAELSKINRNVLLLSRIVGASSGVPVLFPPTSISGDVLVDGGVSDNQGIEPLLRDPDRCDWLLISDASGQMEQLDTIGTSATDVYARTNSILQHQIRSKLLEQLRITTQVRFAFVHLFLNLKDRPDVANRVSSVLIPAVARLRTDLDQFSYIEQEALMYHGYTLMDAQLRRYCAPLYPNPAPPLSTAPLFREGVVRPPENRAIMRCDLEAGAQGVYLLRCAKKYPKNVVPVLAAAVILAAGALAVTLYYAPAPVRVVGEWLQNAISNLLPGGAWSFLNRMLERLGMPNLTAIISGVTGLAAVLLVLGFYLYLLFFFCYNIVRRNALRLDRRNYRKLTGLDPSVEWDEPAQSRTAAV
jgi:predicted acylesterase/phospholipase RssA